MPIWATKEEAIQAHKNYTFNTDDEGKFHPEHPKYTRAVQLMKYIKDGSLVLDIGCNSGGFSRLLMQKKHCTVYGVDVHDGLVEMARQKGVFARVAEAESLPFPDSYFDAVVLGEILEHVYDPEIVLQEAIRVTKLDGVVTGSVPHHGSENAKKGVVDHPYHARIFQKKELRSFLSKYLEGDTLKLDDVYISPPIPFKPQWVAFCGRLPCKL